VSCERARRADGRPRGWRGDHCRLAMRCMVDACSSAGSRAGPAGTDSDTGSDTGSRVTVTVCAIVGSPHRPRPCGGGPVGALGVGAGAGCGTVGGRGVPEGGACPL
jgi:hypothetical protein